MPSQFTYLMDLQYEKKFNEIESFGDEFGRHRFRKINLRKPIEQILIWIKTFLRGGI